MSETCLEDPALKRIYSMHFSPGSGALLAAGGHQGRCVFRRAACSARFGTDSSTYVRWSSVSVFSTPHSVAPAAEPLLSFRAHRGWVAGVQFVSGPGGAGEADPWQHVGVPAAARGTVLATAGNDGVVALWDVSRSKRVVRRARAALAAHLRGLQLLPPPSLQGGDVQPFPLLSASDLHAAGVFSLHELRGVLATGSKDRTVCLASCGEDGRLAVCVRRSLSAPRLCHLMSALRGAAAGDSPRTRTW